MAATIRIKEGLLKRLRESRQIPTEEVQARMIGVDRVTLRRIDGGASPSAAFMAGVVEAFGLGLGEAFDVVSTSTVVEQPEVREAVAS
ncbi:helix-turn-helix transcriptional regulator [Leucobacter chironomi]|uniref:helix-turn-helix transcriptional regulator n=1 Tax=Leucobacter chironomi TaxID=491918 RepID=UPI0004264C7A|nr:helix-turn-helix transcriptional regulator [Leucobacter chironomi]